MNLLRRKVVVAAAALCIATVTGCADSTGNGQPSAQPGTFAWFDLGSDNPDASRAFYEAVFGWKFASGADGEYWTIKAGRTPIGGMFAVSNDAGTAETQSQWIPVVGVTDAVKTSEAAFRLGARQIAPPAQTSDGIYSSIFDPTGAPLDLYQGSTGLPIADTGSVGTWIWADHISSSPNRAAQFYSSLFGWETGKNSDGGKVFLLDGNELGGILNVPRSEAEPNWLPYVAVADLGATIAKAAELGGRLLVQKGDAAILLDPTGAAIGLIAAGG